MKDETFDCLGHMLADWNARVSMYSTRETELGIRLAALAAMYTREQSSEGRASIERRALASRAELAVVSSQHALMVRCVDDLVRVLRKEGPA